MKTRKSVGARQLENSGNHFDYSITQFPIYPIPLCRIRRNQGDLGPIIANSGCVC